MLWRISDIDIDNSKRWVREEVDLNLIDFFSEAVIQFAAGRV